MRLVDHDDAVARQGRSSFISWSSMPSVMILMTVSSSVLSSKRIL